MSFYIVNDIYLKLQKVYNRGDIFKNYIEDNQLFPMVIKLKKVQEKDIQGNFSLLLKQIKSLKETPFHIEYKQFDFKRLGVQTLPVSIKINTVEEYCKIMKNKEFYDKFIEIYKKVIKKYPRLKEYFYKKPMDILEYSLDWDRFFTIVDYFINNQNPNIYIREISLKNIDTKYIEKHKKILDILISTILKIECLSSQSDFAFEKKYKLKYPLAQVRFRIVDEAINIGGLTDLTVCIDQFEKLQVDCKKVFIVENKITFLSFPKQKNSIVIFGNGYGVGVLKNIKWLEEKEIYYWGDIDVDGFAILSQIRGYFQQVQSIFMDKNIINKFNDKAISYKNKKNYKPQLEHLTKEELLLYNDIAIDYRIEQELLPFDFIQNGIKNTK